MRQIIRDLLEQWQHLGEEECIEQIDAHCESDGQPLSVDEYHSLIEYFGSDRQQGLKRESFDDNLFGNGDQ